MCFICYCCVIVIINNNIKFSDNVCNIKEERVFYLRRNNQTVPLNDEHLNEYLDDRFSSK
jgi:hypothetical protein